MICKYQLPNIRVNRMYATLGQFFYYLSSYYISYAA